MTTTEGPTSPAALRQRALRLEVATLGWNVVEAVVALASGAVAASIALLGFGADSVVESAASVIVLWRLRGVDDEREERARRAVALSFVLLAAVVGAQAGIDLLRGARPEASTIGIALTALSLLVMPALGLVKRRVGQRLGSRAVVAGAAQTLLCAAMSAAVLTGLVLNASLGWWWADPTAALVLAALALREAREAWEGDDCC